MEAPLLYAAKRPFSRPIILVLIAASFLLAACGVELPNENWPGLSAVGDMVYVADGQQVIAYNVAQQSQTWGFPAERSNAPFYAPPAVDEDGVVVGDYGASSGLFTPKLIVSQYNLAEQPGAPAIVWQVTDLATDKIIASPLIVENRTYFATSDGKLFALDRVTGRPLWPAPFSAGNAIWGQPVYADGVLYISTVGGVVLAIDPESGLENGRWQITGAIADSPIITDEYIYVGSFDNQLHALDRNTFGAEVWTYPATDWIWGAPTIADGVVYFGDLNGNFFALDAENGRLLWQKQVTGPIQTRPVVADGVVYIVSQGNAETERGQITAFSTDGGAQVWQQEAPAEVYTTPVLVGNFLVVALHKSRDNLLVGFNRENGSQQWTFAPAGR